ncbi:MAG: hypothetical protein KFF73_20075 [Cyclobacteriaceae bacterium]|nr:hypothetical protein [Cyclobacteriaceae bacterium]
MPDIEFSPDEFRLMLDHQIFDIKADIISKIIILFTRVEEKIKNELGSAAFDFPEKLYLRSGKLSKGENYLNCPYLVLDYPRLFSKDDIFSFRTIFWWGHYFSNVIVLGGNSYHKYVNKLINRTGKLKRTDWYLCVHHTPWKLEADDSNFIQIRTLSREEITGYMHRYKFIKIAKLYPLGHYDQLTAGTTRFISRMLEIMR